MLFVPLVVLDTNVLVSALRSRKGAAFRLVSLVGMGHFDVAVSVPLVLEYEDALLRQVGLSPAERSRKASSLTQTIQLQQAALQMGGQDIVVNLNGIHRAVLDWSRAVDLDNAEKYWVDPESQESQQAGAEQVQKQEALEQAQLQTLAAEAAANNANSERDFVMDQLKLQFDYFKAILTAETEESKIEGQATQQLQAQQAAGAERAGGTGNGADLGPAES